MEPAESTSTDLDALLTTLAAQEAEMAALEEALRVQHVALQTLQTARSTPRLRLPGRLGRPLLVAALCALLLSSSASAGIPNTATGAIGMCYRTAGSMNLLYVLDPAQQPGCPTGMTQSSFNQDPLQVALLRWYAANQSGPNQTGITYRVGSAPDAVAFDGANIWVTNQVDNTVTKLRASDGTCNGAPDTGNVSACSFKVGGGPYGVAFDGANIWVVDNDDNAVTKL